MEKLVHSTEVDWLFWGYLLRDFDRSFTRNFLCFMKAPVRIEHIPKNGYVICVYESRLSAGSVLVLNLFCTGSSVFRGVYLLCVLHHHEDTLRKINPQ